MKTNTRILRELAERLKANSNGSLLFFQNAGITITGDYPTLRDVNNLYETNYKEFSNLVKFLFAEEIKNGVANADGTQETQTQENSNVKKEKSYIDLADTAIITVGSTLSSIFGRGGNNQNQQPIVVEQKEKESNTGLYIIIGVVALIIVVGVIYYFMKKR